MILEIADIRIQPGQQAAFEAALAQGVTTAVSQSPGYLSHSVQHGIETPERYVLLIHWNTLEDHTVVFRGSDLFKQWRALVGPFFAAPPVVEHFQLIS